ncbi:MAG: MOSC domain-containing protein, partial [Marmoricola sp.]
GDRWFSVVDAEGRLATGKNSRRFRRFDEIFDYRATMADDAATVAGPGGSWRAGDAALDVALSEHLGAEVRVQRETGTPYKDASPVSLVGTASLDWCRTHFGVDGDVRRLRMNLVVETTEPFVEDTWTGRVLRVGGIEVEVVERTERCRMVDIAQEGLPEQRGWLKALGRERDLCLGVYTDVARVGTVAVGDPVDVTDFPGD